MGWLLRGVLLIALCNCAETHDATQVLAVVYTNLTPGEHLTRVKAQVVDPEAEFGSEIPERAVRSSAEWIVAEQRGSSAPVRRLPFTFGITPQREGELRGFRLVVTGYGPLGEGGDEVAVVQQMVKLGYRMHEKLLLEVFLWDTCLERLCKEERESGDDSVCRARDGECDSVPEIDDLPRATDRPIRRDAAPPGIGAASDGGMAGTSGSAGSSQLSDAGTVLPSAGTRGNAGASGTTAGSGGTASPSNDPCVNDAPVATMCPTMPPATGACAQSGQCCHRSSNRLKEQALGSDEPLELEYRMQFGQITNHPRTVGTKVLVDAATARYEREQQSMLWRFTLPRESGVEVDGMGTFEIGTGRYNCDGTYSFYSETAAPQRPYSNDPARWAPTVAQVNVDASKTGVDRIQQPFSDPAGTELIYTPFLANPGLSLEYEQISQGFTMTQADLSGEGRDCVGGRNGPTWEAGGEFVTYVPLGSNDEHTIGPLSQTYCQLLAFGFLPEGMKDMRCTTTPRCLPDGGSSGDGSCPWLKLPDALCPVLDAEKAMWKCHLGVQTNVNAEAGYPTEVPCTPDAPIAPLDPAAGATSTGQCCDPLGDDSTLPACNAYRVVQSFVAAAAEIIEDPADELQRDCLSGP